MPPPDRPVVPRQDSPGPDGRLTRRRLLVWSALAAATPLGAGLWPARAVAESDGDAYQRAFQQAVAADQDVRWYAEPGREFLYRPRQLLVANPDTTRVLVRLREQGHQATPAGSFAGVTRLRFGQETDVPAVVSALRDPRQWPNQPVPRVQPHHVVVGFGNIMGNPGSPPRDATPLAPPAPTRAGEGAGVTVGICDTGIWRLAADRHPQWLGGSYLPQLDDEDPLYLSADILALQGGHGTFVAGVVRQAAPGVRLDPEPALAHTGLGDEEMLVRALAALAPEVSVVNLSLGCFTQDDQPSLPLAQALAARPSGSVVVAAAGNAGTSRPAWPAAFPDVLAVSAVSPGQSGPVPAPYSGFGSWVDACAVGERTSTYVDGRLVLPGLPTRLFTGFAAWAGTSFAAAHVSGRLAALMTTAGLDAEAARAALLAAPRWHPDYGVLVD
ncbi:S8/S53 family peptidase [Micromonospora sp. HM5-17]|uniref:S8 family peptidase n=1 Tax=Micromonospora sp. HM5-17 TaxID=2487710 RepID=UPI001F17F281|nr:S8/S53 family peptidase [Micromonospora sp. HM5-17]